MSEPPVSGKPLSMPRNPERSIIDLDKDQPGGKPFVTPE